MSAPDTDIDKQKRRHRTPLWGMWGGLILVAILFFGWLAFWPLNPDTDAGESIAPTTADQVESSDTAAPTAGGTTTAPSE
ncbi:hypothetical protein [Salipiger sp.]|uniref:hypothetical protein n=1 Tax=Salipiger sp. TaxID=2078585 RepID=UPI003A9766C8